MPSGDYLRSYKLKQASVIVPMGDSTSLIQIPVYTHITHTSTLPALSVRFLSFEHPQGSEKESGCAMMIGQRKKKKEKPSQKKKRKMTDQGREGFAKILFDYFFYLYFFLYSFLDNSYTCAKLRICNNHIYPRQKTKGLGDILVFV